MIDITSQLNFLVNFRRDLIKEIIPDCTITGYLEDRIQFNNNLTIRYNNNNRYIQLLAKSCILFKYKKPIDYIAYGTWNENVTDEEKQKIELFLNNMVKKLETGLVNYEEVLLQTKKQKELEDYIEAKEEILSGL